MPKKLFYTEKELPQRSENWLKERESCIGGSDLASVLGLMDKYTKPQTLWKRKTGKLAPKKSNAAMERGTSMEGEASKVIIKHLKEVEGIKNPKITPLFAKHPEYEWLGVSFDGVDIKNKFITEIKCPQNSWNFKSVFENGIQDYYYPQVQLQLAVAHAIWGIDKAYFCSYFPDGAYIYDNIDFIERFKQLAVIDVDYDPAYFEEVVKVAKLFWDSVETKAWDKKTYENALKEFKKYEVQG